MIFFSILSFNNNFFLRNVFLHNDIIKIGDFGIEPNNLNKNAETILAEMAYLAPEAFGSNGYTVKSDIW